MVEKLMKQKRIKYRDLSEPLDYSSDEEKIQGGKDVLTEDITAVLQAFNLGVREKLVRNTRRETLDQGYELDEDSDKWETSSLQKESK